MSNIRFGKVFISEILLAIAVGALPLIIAYRSDPDLKIAERLSKLNPGDPVVAYAAYLLALHVVVWSLNALWLKPSETIKSVVSEAHKFTHQLGFTIQSIYRAIAGAVPAAIILMIVKVGYEGATKVVTFSILLTIGCLLMSVVLTVLKDISKPK
jgi:hypothetical protein